MEVDASANTTFVTFWRVTITMEGKHVLTPTTYKDVFFKTKEAADIFMEKNRSVEYSTWCDASEVLAVKLVRPGKPDTYFPLEKPLFFNTS